MKLKDIIKTENIIKVSPEERLAAVLRKLNSSHDAAFVFDQDKFIGLINPYYTLIKNSYPNNTKVKHCLFYPPKIKTNFPLFKVAQLFVQTKVHYLPVFDDEERFQGIISARRLLRQFIDHPLLQVKIKELLDKKKQPLVTIFENGNVSQALDLFKSKKVSKLVVIDKSFRLKGILSYYDLIDYLTFPKKRESKGDRVGGKINFNYYPIKFLIKRYVLTLKETDWLKEVLRLIIEKKLGSVVIVREEKMPVGIITTRDLLNFIFQPKNGARLLVKEEKQGGVFKAALSLFTKKGQPEVIKKEGKNFLELLKKLR